MTYHLIRNRNAFTLLEVMIAFLILIMISFAIYRATTNTFKMRAEINEQGDFYSRIRLAASILERDIAHIYSPHTALPPHLKKINPIENGMQEVNLPGSQFWGKLVHPSGIRSSRFIGSSNTLQFISASHQRVYPSAKESTFEKLTYRLEADPQAQDAMAGTQILVRIANSDAFDTDGEDPKKNKVYALFKGISRVTFNYIQLKKSAKTQRWDSESYEHNGLFPDIIEMELEIKGLSKLSFQGNFKFRLEVPLHGIRKTL